MKRKSKYSQEVVDKAIYMHASGQTAKAVSESLKVPYNNVLKWVATNRKHQGSFEVPDECKMRISINKFFNGRTFVFTLKWEDAVEIFQLLDEKKLQT